jgi:hypothetical protein
MCHLIIRDGLNPTWTIGIALVRMFLEPRTPKLQNNPLVVLTRVMI